MHPLPAPGFAGLGQRGRLTPLCLLCLLCWCGPARSAAPAPLADPTRPPGALATTSAGNTPRSGRPLNARHDNTKPDSSGTAPGPAGVALNSVQLQAIQTSSGKPPVAMVDGQLVRLGDSVAGRTVLAIDSQGLLLRGAAGPERLWLLTDNPKQTAGSITTTRSAVYLPAVPGTDGPADANPQLRAERNASNNTNTPTGTAAALSLVGRTTP